VKHVQVTSLQSWAPYLLSILRILAAGSLFTHGTMTLFAWPAPFEYPMNTIQYAAAILEVFGGALLVVGVFSRPVAFVLSGLMAFAYFIAHGSEGFSLCSTKERPRCFSALSSFISQLPAVAH
jgi:putative oxidoreductase